MADHSGDDTPPTANSSESKVSERCSSPLVKTDVYFSLSSPTECTTSKHCNMSQRNSSNESLARPWTSTLHSPTDSV